MKSLLYFRWKIYHIKTYFKKDFNSENVIEKEPNIARESYKEVTFKLISSTIFKTPACNIQDIELILTIKYIKNWRFQLSIFELVSKDTSFSNIILAKKKKIKFYLKPYL